MKKRFQINATDLPFRLGTGSVAFIVVAAVFGIAYVLWSEATLSIHSFGWHFWQTSVWDPVADKFGARPFIWGTLYSSILALLISTPVAVGIAVFLSDWCPHWLRTPLVFLTELLASIPSIVYGLWGIFVLVPAVRAFQISLPGWVRAMTLFSGPAVGASMLAAAVILAVMIVPFTSSIAREVLKSVPSSQGEAAYALGATRWEATRVNLRYARTGIFGAVMLGFGRALGETMAVTMVIGNSPQAKWSLFAPQYTMSAVIANEFTEAVGPLHLDALVEIGLVLFVITLIVNFASRMMIWQMSRPSTRKRAPVATPVEVA